MNYPLLVAAVAALMLTACEYKKHPMDKPPPSAMAERDSAPKFDELDKEGADTQAGTRGADANVKKEEPGK
jgi:uncharacterized lipoprotein YajG